MKNSFEEWLQMIQGLMVPQNVYELVQSRVDPKTPIRLLMRQVREVLRENGLNDSDASYIVDHLQGYHIEPLDFIVNAQILDLYMSYTQRAGFEWFPYNFVFKKIMEQLGYAHLVGNIKMPVEKTWLFERRWQELME